MAYKLGRLPSPPDPRTLRLANYLDLSQLPPIPAAYDWGDTIASWPMYLNDKIGDCTCAAAAHLIRVWLLNEGRQTDITDADVQRAYSAVGGYVPGRPATDRGANMLDVLKYWRATGIRGHNGIGYVSADPKNIPLIKAGIYLFGGLYGGCQIPQSWLTGQWDRVSGAWAGGHAWTGKSYNEAGEIGVITWGGIRKFTARGWAGTMASQQDAEVFFVLGPEWTGPDAKAPNGFHIRALQNDLAEIAGQPLPWPDEGQEPPPEPPAPTYLRGVLSIDGYAPVAVQLPKLP